MALSTISGTTGITDATITSAKLADFAAAVDLNGVELILDADQDTSITADTDDRIDFKIANVEHFSFSNSSGDTIVKPMVDAKDIKFQQYDGRTLLDINDGGFVGIANGATGAGAIRIFEDTDNGSNYVGLSVGNVSTSYTLVFPNADGSSGQVMTTNGSGVLSFADASANTPSSADGQALGSASLEWSDLFLADASTIQFGNDQDVILTHVADTGLLLSGTNVIQFNDASQNIGAPSATVLDINATDEIELNATLVDVNANLDVSGTIVGASTLSATTGTFSGILKTDDATDATSTTDGSLQTDGGLSVAKDTIIGNDLKLLSDSAVLVFGAGSDATLTHTNDTGLTLNSTNKLMFNDASQFIQGASATVLDIAATDEIELTATLIEVVGNATVSGTLGVTGVTTSNAGIVVDNITIDGTEIDLSSGSLTVDVAGDIILDSGDGVVKFQEAGSDRGRIYASGSNVYLKSDVSDKDLLFQGNDGGAAITALTLDMSDNGAATFNDNIYVYDDKGIVFGTGGDWMIGAAAGEGSVQLFRGSDNTQGAEEGKIAWGAGATGNESSVVIQSGEGADVNARVYVYGDQGDDTDDQWIFGADSGSAVIDSALNTTRQNILFDGNGNAYADATFQDNAFDYAELFEWKTHLSNDSDINALWGKTVVLDGDKVKLAEDGDEANVIGIIRPKGSTSSHGDGLQWDGKWKKDVWGNYETENYTRVTWQGEKGYRHSYPKDRIPTHQLKMGIGEDKDIHKKESSFELDKEGNKIAVVVPSTAEEKTATNYLERTHRKGKADVPLTRRIYNNSYNPDTVYNRREDRPKEWVLIGMLGQVPVRDSTIIPTHWKKMKNLESGIDKYFIFNK